jgi:sugar phosphate isomerase/epimerase
MMPLAVSTHWNTHKHTSGEALVEETLELGFKHLELGYDLTPDLIAGVKSMVEQKTIQINSVHNFCPVPMGASRGHPELFELASLSPMERESAIQLTIKTVLFAADMGAKNVVLHCGNIRTKPSTRKLIQLSEDGKQNSAKYEKQKTKLMIRREKPAQKYIDNLYRSLEKMLPTLEEHNVSLGIENLPSWEAIPTEQEMEALLKHFDSPFIRHWHDTGHGKIRQNLGFINQIYWIEKLSGFMSGMHLHDVKPPATDHIMPPFGNFVFTQLAPFIKNDTVLVMEPMPGTPPEDVLAGKELIENALNSLSE